MQFSDSSTSQGLVEDTRYLVDADSVSYPIADLTRNINNWYDKAVSLIFIASGRWQWDDQTNTDYPVATAQLNADQQDYTLDVSFVRIHAIEIKDQDGNWQRLMPIDWHDITGSITDFKKTAGTPAYYDSVSSSIFLYPKPDYTQAASLKVFVQRGANHFETTDTTRVPGFPTPFHRYLSLGAAYDFALKYGLQNRNQLREELLAMEEEIKNFFAVRQQEDKPRLVARKISYR